MKKHQVDLPKDLEEIMSAIDSDGSGTIDYTEFIAATLTAKQYQSRETLWAAFRTFDTSGDGSISRDELAELLAEGTDSAVVDQMMSEVDTNQDGKITFDEF